MSEVKTLSVRRNVIYAAIANGIFALTQWGILTVVARVGPASDVGVITLVSALITPIFLFAQMAMREGHSVDDLEEFDRRDYVALRLVSSVLAFGATAVLVATYLAPTGIAAQVAAIAFALVKLLGAQMNMNHGIFQRAERLDYVAASLVARGFLGLIAFAATYFYTKNLALAFLAEAAMWWLCLLLVDRRFLRRLNAVLSWRELTRANPGTLWKLTKWMAPLGFAVMLMSFALSAPVIVLERNVDLAVVGVFGAIAYVNNALTIFSNAIGQASSARLRKLYRLGKRGAFLRLSFKLTAASAAIGLALWFAVWLFGEWILTMLYGEKYADAGVFEISIIAAAMRIATAPLQIGLSAGQAFLKRMVNSGVTLVVSLVAAFWLIPSSGAEGAAWVLAIISLTNLALTLYSFRQVIREIPQAA